MVQLFPVGAQHAVVAHLVVAPIGAVWTAAGAVVAVLVAVVERTLAVATVVAVAA